MEGWPEAREINTEGWLLQEEVRAGDSGGQKLGLPGLSSSRDGGMGVGTGNLGPEPLTLECVRVLLPTQGKWSGGWGCPSLGQPQSQDGRMQWYRKSLALVARVRLAGGGEPADARQLRTAAAAGAPNAPLSPSPRLVALSPPIIRIGGGFFLCPQDSRRCCPTASTLSPGE